MASLPTEKILRDEKICIVMREVPNELNHYDLWYDDLGPNMIRVRSRLKFEPGQWVEYVDNELRPLDCPPIKTERLRRNSDKHLFKLTTKVLKPEPEYFEAAQFVSMKKYTKYLGLSADFGRIFLSPKLAAAMKDGVLYDMDICNFALLPPESCSEKDRKVLIAMRVVKTLWLSCHIDKIEDLPVASLSDREYGTSRHDFLAVHDYNLKPLPAIKEVNEPFQIHPPKVKHHNTDAFLLKSIAAQKSASHILSSARIDPRSVHISDTDFLRSLAKIVRQAFQQVNADEELKRLDSFIRNPPF